MKKIQFLRNDTVYTPSNSGTALQTAKNAIMSLEDIYDGEIVLARYQESSNEDIKTLLCIYYNGSTDTGWTFIGGLKAEIEEAEEIIAQALSDLDERVTENASAIDSMSDLPDRMTQAESDITEIGKTVEDNELVTARALTELSQQIAELEEQSPIGYTETDPVFEASPAHGITSSDITNWNSKTSNVGTVTGVKMNNTTNNPTDGVVDLGTVITQETQLTVTVGGKGNAVTGITVNNHNITLQKGTFLTEHQDITGKANVADLATVATSGSYNDLANKPTIPTVNDPTITLTFNGSTVGTFTLNQSGNQTIDIGTIIGLPSFSASNNGQILGVVNGQLAWVTPTTIYTGSGAPSSSQGNDGDIYLQTS